MSEYPFTMASFIEGVRTRRSLSQADLARKIGVTQQSVSKWEAGTASPRGEQLAQLNEALDIAPAEWEDLLAGLDELEACGPCGGLRRVRRWQSGGRIASMADVALACPQCGRQRAVEVERGDHHQRAGQDRDLPETDDVGEVALDDRPDRVQHAEDDREEADDPTPDRRRRPGCSGCEAPHADDPTRAARAP